MELIVEGLSHSFGSLQVLVNVSFRVSQGEILGIVGPSGCGKSTLLSIAGGLIKPVRGTVATKGAAPAGSRNPITFVFQDFALLPWRSVEDNVAFPLQHRDLTAADRKAVVAEALARTGLTEFARALPKQLSGGMKQRVGIARALAVDPAVLLLDEPLSALDSQTSDLLIDDLSRLMANSSMSAVYVTHNLSEAVRLADRVLVFSRRPGRIKEAVTVDIPRSERTRASAATALSEVQSRLWSLIRDEAAVADREIIDVE